MRFLEFGEKDKMRSIAFISGSSPEFLGGISLYQRNLIHYANKNRLKLHFIWIYPGREDKKYSLEGINCLEIKNSKIPFIREFDFARKARKTIKKENFELINTHANWGYCLRGYEKREAQKIIHTYHGVTLPYMRIQLKRFNFIKRILLSPLLLTSYLLEKPPMKKADKIICVSEKVKTGLEEVYFKRKNMNLIEREWTPLNLKKCLKRKQENP